MPSEVPAATPTAWVTGITGYWGRNVALCLLRQGWGVVGLSRCQPKDLQSWAEAQGKSLQWFHFDLADPNWDPLLDFPQAIFHCAARFDQVDQDLALMMQVNVLGPIQLIEQGIQTMSDGGRIGVFLGQNGRIGLPGLGEFSATQAALWTWAEARSRSLAGSRLSLSLVFPPRAPSGLQAQLASQLSRPPQIRQRPTADPLVKGVLAGKRRVGRWPWLAGVATLLW
ncbi:NAD-dependent epimerase/dehydratase family protein [Synechococcus sp. Nb3U1]|uniref:NAD-dependent epimerase/dehydratase family protein n=1 Tax=Synechococcus sp. Nb3U1 TaxID=1914529 RepID=UPI001F2C2005|nr:NAD-dependent epimerase/dehydratase family protein [Synechococcus sp. Nb3U1]MCF2970564.1 NAD-dependent epimerase/dehydratase family protein [Synechococcus sp. Nb3U1]